MDTKVDNIIETGEIPNNIYSEINILDGAPERFISEVIKLESMSNLRERAVEAYNYLVSSGGFTQIDFKTLGRMLSSPDKIDIRNWRNLYLLERSIAPRNSRWTWLNRLKMFYNTYLEEHQLVYKPYKNSKFYFLDKSGDHENLHAGNGTFGSDFYYFDDTISGTTWNKMVKVEMKYAYGDLNSEVIKYNPTNKNHTYEASHVILYKEGDGYYMVDYQCESPLVEKLDHVKEPTGLFKISL